MISTMQSNRTSTFQSISMIVRMTRLTQSAIIAVFLVGSCALFVAPANAQNNRSVELLKKAVENKTPKHNFKSLDNTSLLTWNNGNVLPGILTKGTDSKLHWNSELFRGDLKLDFTALNNIRFPRDATKQVTTEKYLIRTVNGDKLFGNVTRIKDGSLVLSSERHGEVTIGLDKIFQIVDLENSGSVFIDISDLESWISLSKKKNDWKVTDLGELKTARRNVDLQYETELPESVQIDVVVKWEKKLDFLLGLGAPDATKFVNKMPHIATWQDALVLNHEEDFAIIYDTIDPKTKRLALQIQWNRKTNVVTVRDEKGKELCSTPLPAGRLGLNDGIYIANKSGDLQIDSLRINKMAAEYDPSRIGVQVTEGLSAYGELVGFDGKNWTVADKLVPASTFRSAVLNLETLPNSDEDNILLRYHDGSTIHGKLVGAADNKLSLKTNFVDKPVESNLLGASIVRFQNDPKQNPKLKAEGKHRLFSDYGILFGQITAGSGKQHDVIRWKPVGCEEGLPLTNGNSRIVLSEEKDYEESDPSAIEWPDTIYLNNKDILPCRVNSITDDKILFESFVDNGAISQSEIKAIDFARSEDAGPVSFLDPAWSFPTPVNMNMIDADEEIEGEAEEAEEAEQGADESIESDFEMTGPNELIVNGPQVFGHRSLSTLGSLKFNLEWKRGTFTAMKIRQFQYSPQDNRGGGIGATLNFSDRTVSVTTLDNRRISGQARVTAQNHKAEIDMHFDGKMLTVSVNGQKIYEAPADLRLVKGTALSIALQDKTRRAKLQLKIKDISVDRSRTISSPVLIEPSKLERLLTIPRLRKDNPPTHILCARNQDFLRGELSSLDQDKIKFESLREDFTFERNLVSSIVWLREKPDFESETIIGVAENKGKTIEDQVVQVLLRSGKRLTLNAESLTDDTFNGASDLLGQCGIPIDEILELRLGDFATEATDVAYADWVAIPARKPDLGRSEDEGDFGKTSELVGSKAQDFSLKLLDGSDFVLSEQKGKVVILDFWATWCGPCIRSLPDMIEVTNSFDPDKVVFVAVNERESSELVKDYLDQKRWKMTVGLDNGDVAQLFDVEAIPYTVIIDQKGNIAFVNVGASDEMKPKMLKAIQEIAGPAAAPSSSN